MPSSTKAIEIAAMLSGHARRCGECKNVILVSEEVCPYCLADGLRVGMRQLQDEIDRLKMTWQKWPTSASDNIRWFTLTKEK